jgi:rSAM/selenodomain-associated transferase 1
MELAELAVFVRAPLAGAVKTRLQRELGPDQAAALYRAFVEDVVVLCNRIRRAGRVRVALWGDDASDPSVRAWAEALDTSPRQQPEGDLGVRMGLAFRDGLANAERVVLIGSDAPTLPFATIVSAFNRLENDSLVLGPSNDGGYFLIGASGASPRFDGVRWSTEFAFRDTVAANASADAGFVPPWYDVDDPLDLHTLRAHLSADPKAAPATAKALQKLSQVRDRAS